MKGPTERSLKLLRNNGYRAQVTEKWNAFAKVRQDLFGFIDIVAIRENASGVLGIQTTSMANLSKRLEKIRELDTPMIWLKAGNRIHIHGWRKMGARGERKLWKCCVTEVKLEQEKLVANDLGDFSERS